MTIVARDFPRPFETLDPVAQINYTSPWGGAHNRFVPPTNAAEADEHRMSVATTERMRALLRQSESGPGAGAIGVTFMRGVEYLEAPGPQYLAVTEERARGELGLSGFRLLRREELPDDKVAWGCEYETWCVNPMVYCSFLLRRFVCAGGRVVEREVSGPAEIFSIGGELGPVDVVINASGSGFGDPNVFPTRGLLQSQRNRFGLSQLTDDLQVKHAWSPTRRARRPLRGKMRTARGASASPAVSTGAPSSAGLKNRTTGTRTRYRRHGNGCSAISLRGYREPWGMST